MLKQGSVGGITGKHIFLGIMCVTMSKSEWLLNIRLTGCLLLVKVLKPRPKPSGMMLLKKEHKPQVCNLPRWPYAPSLLYESINP